MVPLTGVATRQTPIRTSRSSSDIVTVGTLLPDEGTTLVQKVANNGTVVAGGGGEAAAEIALQTAASPSVGSRGKIVGSLERGACSRTRGIGIL